MLKDFKLLAKTAAALSLFLIGSCNFATHSFNLGKLLLPGESMTTLSAGKRSMYDIVGTWDSQYDSAHNYIGSSLTPTDTISGLEWSGAIDYRLGVLSKYPFGKGIEIGFLLEFPSQLERMMGPPVLQFDARLGLPLLSVQRSLYHHNVGLGWIVGAWIDNGWFAEYAGGLECGPFTPYYNIRATRTPTDFDAITSSGDDFLSHHRRGWNFRACAGLSMQIDRLPILPDFIVPEITVVYPNAVLRKPGFAFHIGARWLYGF